MSDRAAILRAVRRASTRRVAHPGSYPAPAMAGGWEGFSRTLSAVGGDPHGPFAVGELAGAVADLARARAAGGRIVATEAVAAQLGDGPWATPGLDASPHSFEDVAVAIVRGSSAAAECAAIAVRGDESPDRALPFLCRHLILVLPVAAIAPDLHTAWAALPAEAFQHHHLTWISGPSKTADIEQTLVYGAHGPLSCDVVGFTD